MVDMTCYVKPPRHKGRYPFERMHVGDYFDIPDRKGCSVKVSISNLTSGTERRFATFTLGQNRGVRVFLVDDKADT